MDPNGGRDTSRTLRDRIEVALYREVRLLERQGAVRLRTAAAALVLVAALVGTGGYGLGAATGGDPGSPAPAPGLASAPSPREDPTLSCPPLEDGGRVYGFGRACQAKFAQASREHRPAPEAEDAVLPPPENAPRPAPAQ